MRYICTPILVALILAGASSADTINVPADYDTIQEAIGASQNGDVVLVQPGIYTGTGEQVVRLMGKSITLAAAGSPEATVIDGEN
ncbi:MAG: hypothetical protein P8M32_10025 [Phycisphaerales bacterium]|nr:hypothetical protein [Phycisphaerales bacterium]